MARTTIACASCRRQKVKCIHEGLPPCRDCSKKGRVQPGQCVLTGPTPSRHSRLRRSEILRRTNTPSESNGNNARARSGIIPSIQRADAQHQPSDRIDALFQPDSVVVLRACLFLKQKLPEIQFLHLPTASNSLRYLQTLGCHSIEQESYVLRIFFLAVMAVYAVIGENKAELPTADQLANAVRDRVTVSTPPSLVTVQTLLVLSMYEWGAGNRHQAWSTSGMAIRMMQSLQATTTSVSHSPTDLEIYNRTLWGCFMIDRLILSGVAQPHSLSCDSLRTSWPSSEEDFVFGRSQVALDHAKSGQNVLDDMPGDMTNFYNVLVRGFDIWARILQWIISGGRFLPGMSLVENCPWSPTSPWASLYHELRTWRSFLDERMLFPESSVASHAALQQAEPFAYLNLVYYVSLLFLNREYLPFLPTTCDRPSGPMDPPLLPPDAPTEWWHDRAVELFASAASITKLMKDLDDVDASLHTPFPGFCVFSALTTNLYRSAFPWMSPDRIQENQSLIERDFAWLDRFRKVWPVGERWWLTSQQCERLYNHASVDLGRFSERPRTDFDALESSIHDCQRRRPSVELGLDLFPETCLSQYRTSMHLEEHRPSVTNHTRDTQEMMLQSYMGWSQLWQP